MSNPAHVYARSVDALNRGQWVLALQLAQQVLPHAGELAHVHFVAGVAALRLNQLSLAVPLLEKALRLAPGKADFGAELARALLQSRRVAEAVDVAEKAAAKASADTTTLELLANVFTLANRHDKALPILQRVAQARPDHAGYRFNLATSLLFHGQLDAAREHYEACVALRPDYWKAHLGLADLRKQEPADNHVERLRGLLASHGGDHTAAMYLHLSLAKELDDLGQYPAAFEHLVAGKKAARAHPGSTPGDYREVFDTLQRVFPERIGGAGGDPTGEPIFVFGLPRTGTTLVERILTSHPDVHSAGELPNFGEALRRLSGVQAASVLDPRVLAAADPLHWAGLGAAYLDSTRPDTGHKPRFIDKLPHNFLFAAHIAQALPNARMICLRRHPMDSCLNNFRQIFALRSPYLGYAFDLLDTAAYYRQFDQLMAHWRRVMPGRILEIAYEDIIEDQEAATRQLLSFCGLSWDAACLGFENNAAPVATASAAQVRQPIYRSSLQRWRRYEPQLQELKQALADLLPRDDATAGPADQG